MMASQLVKNLTRTSLNRQSALTNKIQKRNSTTSPASPPPPISEKSSSSSSSGLPLAVGLSLGLSVGVLAQSNLISKLFPSDEPKVEARDKPATPSMDPKLVEEMINQSRRLNQLEMTLNLIRDERFEREQQQPQSTSRERLVPSEAGDVFELSRILEANQLAASSRLQRELSEQQEMLTIEHMMKVEGEILKVENKYRPTLNRIKELDADMKALRELREKEAPARMLWLSCQSLLDRMRHESYKPLEKDAAYEFLKEFAAKDDQLASSVLKSIPAQALTKGVPSEESLRARFNNIERLCKRVAAVGEGGGGIAKYLMSYLQSLLIFDNVTVSEDEVRGRTLVDPSKWNTYDILARVKYCLQLHDMEQAVRYANQLRGQARVVARDWIHDARAYLELQQAFNVLRAYSESIQID